MFPWLFFWATFFSPHFNYPLSGAVKQAFSQDAFFGSIDPTAGNGNVEQVIFNFASYGRQIGMLTDAVALLLKATDLTPVRVDAFKQQKPMADLPREKAVEVIDQFTRTYRGIETIKKEFSQSRVDTVTRILPP